MSTSAKYPVSASSAVCRMVLRNVSDQMFCNVAEHASDLVRNVPEQVRNVSGSGSGMVPDVGHQVPDVGGQVGGLGTKAMFLYGRG